PTGEPAGVGRSRCGAAAAPSAAPPRRGRGAWRDRGPAHHAVAIPNLNLSCYVFTHHDRTACRSVSALPLELEEAVVIAHDPVIRDGAFFFQAKDGIESQPARSRHVKVVGRGGRLREAGIVARPVLRLEKGIRRLDIRNAFP